MVKLTDEQKAAKELEKKVAADKKAVEKTTKEEEKRLAKIESDRLKTEAEAKKPKPSIRDLIESKGRSIINDTEKLIAKVDELEKFAQLNKRPARHFFHFKLQLGTFKNQFNRMLR